MIQQPSTNHIQGSLVHTVVLVTKSVLMFPPDLVPAEEAFPQSLSPIAVGWLSLIPSRVLSVYILYLEYLYTFTFH